MSKVDVNLVAEAMKSEAIEPAVVQAVIEKLNLAANGDEPEGEKAPAVKKQFVVIVSDPHGALPRMDFVAWVAQIPESESPATTLDRVFRSAYDYNTTKKGRLLPVKTVGEALEAVPAKFFKEADIWVKTTTPVLVVKTDNEIPTEEPSYDNR